MFFGFGASSSSGAKATASRATAGGGDRQAKLLASAFHESLESLMVESSKHRGMNTVRDMAHATRAKNYAPNDLLHTFIVACEICEHRKSCHFILLQCLGDLSKLFSLNLMPVTVPVAEAVCDMVRKLALVLPNRTDASSHVAPPSSRAAAGHQWALIDDEEVLLRMMQLLVSALSACPLGNAALAELLGLLVVFYAGASPGSMLEEVCGTTLFQRTHMYCTALLHSSLDKEPRGDIRESRATAPSSANVSPSEGDSGPSSTSFNAQLHAVAYFKDLCALAGGKSARWLKLTVMAVRPQGGGIPMAQANTPLRAAGSGGGGGGGGGGGMSSKPLGTPHTLSLSASGMVTVSSPLQQPVPLSTQRSTSSHLLHGDASFVEDEDAHPSLHRGDVSINNASASSSSNPGGGGAGTVVAMAVIPHRLRVFLLRTLTQFFDDQPTAREFAANATNGVLTADDATAAASVNLLFSQCLNEDIIGLAVATKHPAFDAVSPLLGSAMGDSPIQPDLVAENEDASLNVTDDVSTGDGYAKSIASGSMAAAAAGPSGAVTPPAVLVTGKTHHSNSTTATTATAGDPATGHSSGLAELSYLQQQRQEEARQRQRQAQQRRLAKEAGEAEQRFVMVQKLALLVLQKYAVVMRNTTNSLVLTHAMLLKQCGACSPPARMFHRVPGTMASPLAVAAVLLALWKKAIASETLLRLLLTTHMAAATTGAAAPSTTSAPASGLHRGHSASPSSFGAPEYPGDEGAGVEHSGSDGEWEGARAGSSNATATAAAVAGQLPAFAALVSECSTLVCEVASHLLRGDALDATEGEGSRGRTKTVKDERQEAPPDTAMTDVKEYLSDALAFLTTFGQSFAHLTELASAAAHTDDRINRHPHHRQSPVTPGATALLSAVSNTPMPTGAATTVVPVVMPVADIRALFLVLYPSLLKGASLALQGGLDEDALHLALKGVTHWAGLAARLGLDEERNGFLKALLAALRRHDPMADAILAYAVQHHPAAAQADRQSGGAPLPSTGQGASKRRGSAARPHPGSSHHQDPDEVGLSGSGVGGEGEGEATESFGNWVMRNMRRFAQDAAGGSTSEAHATGGGNAGGMAALFSGVNLANLAKKASLGNKKRTTAGAGVASRVSGGVGGGGGAGTSAAAPLFTANPEDQAHIMLAVERLQQKFFVLRALFTVASSMGEALEADGWAILAEGLATIEPCIYRLQLFILWIAEAAVEREQQQQLLSDAYHLRDALRTLFMECALSFSDGAYHTFLTAMITATVERSATMQARLAARYTDVLDGDESTSSESEQDVRSPHSVDGATGTTNNNNTNTLTGKATGDHSSGTPVLTSGTAAYGYGCFWLWRLVGEGLGLAYLALLPLDPARAALTWQGLTQLYGYVLHPQRLEQWCSFLKAFPLRVSMLAYYEDANARGAAAAAASAGTVPGVASPGQAAGASSIPMTSAAVAAAAAMLGGGGGGSGSAGGGGIAGGSTMADGNRVPVEMRELYSVLAGFMENISVVAAFASVYAGRALRVAADMQRQQQSATPPKDIPHLVEATVGRIVGMEGNSGGSATASTANNSSSNSGGGAGAGAVANSALGTFGATRLARVAMQVLAPPVVSHDVVTTPTVFDRLVDGIRTTNKSHTPTVVTPLVVARRLVNLLAVSVPLPFQLLDELFAGFQTAVKVVIVTRRKHKGTTNTNSPTPSTPPPSRAALTTTTLGQEAFDDLCHEMAYLVLKEVQRLVQGCGEDIRGAAWTHLLRLLQRTITGSDTTVDTQAARHTDAREDRASKESPSHRSSANASPAPSSKHETSTAAVAAAPDRAVQLAFRTLEAVQHNCITNLDTAALEQLMRSAGAFIGYMSATASKQEKRLHTNLSAVQMLWSVADYVATLDAAALMGTVGFASSPNHNNSNSNSSSSNGGGGAPTTANHVEEARDRLWRTLLLQLQENGCLDARQEVRQSAQKTLYALVQTHGGQYGGSCWRCVLNEIIAPQMDVVLSAQRDRCHHDLAAAQGAGPSLSPIPPSETSEGSSRQPFHRGSTGATACSGADLSTVLFLSDENTRAGAPTHHPVRGLGHPSPANIFDNMPPPSAKALALRRIFCENLSAMEEMRITVTDGAGRVFATHYLAMRHGGAGVVAASAKPVAVTEATTAPVAAAVALVEAALRAFIQFTGDVCVVLMRGTTGARGGVTTGFREESALSAIHALHSLLVEVPDTSASTASTHALRHLCWRSLEHILFFDPAKYLALTAAERGASPSVDSAGADKTSARSVGSSDSSDHRTPAVVSALIAALCDDFTTKRAYYGALNEASPSRKAQDGASPPASPQPASSTASSSFFSRFVAFSYADDGEFQDDDDDDVRIEGRTTDKSHLGTIQPTHPHPEDDPYFVRLVAAMVFANTCEAVVASYFFPSKVQNTLAEAVVAIWPLLRGPLPLPRTVGVGPVIRGPATSAPTHAAAAWRVAYSEQERVMREVIWPQFPSQDRVQAFVEASNVRGPAAESLSLHTLRDVMPPGSHPSVLLQTLSLVAGLVLEVDLTQPQRDDAGAVSAPAPAAYPSSRGSTASVAGEDDATQVAFKGLTVGRFIRAMTPLLMLQYASAEAQAGAVPGSMSFGVPASFFEDCLRLLQAVLWQVVAVVRQPAGHTPQEAAAWLACRREGVTAFGALVRQLVSLATATVKVYETPSPREDEDTSDASKRGNAARAPTYGPAVLPDSLHAALSTLDALVMDSAALVQRLMVDVNDSAGAAEVIGALVMASSMDAPSLANVAQRSLNTLKEWSAEAGAPVMARPLVAEASASVDPKAAADASRAQGDTGRHALSALVRTSLYQRCHSIMAQYRDDPGNVNTMGMLQETLENLAQSCPPPPAHRVRYNSHQDARAPGIAQGQPSDSPTATKDPNAEERELLRSMLPQLAELVAVSSSSKSHAELSAALSKQLAATLMAVYSSLGLL